MNFEDNSKQVFPKFNEIYMLDFHFKTLVGLLRRPPVVFI